jgi:hypothetical protein
LRARRSIEILLLFGLVQQATEADCLSVPFGSEAGVTQPCCDAFAEGPVKDTLLLTPIAVLPTQNPGDGLMAWIRIALLLASYERKHSATNFPL